MRNSYCCFLGSFTFVKCKDKFWSLSWKCYHKQIAEMCAQYWTT